MEFTIAMLVFPDGTCFFQQKITHCPTTGPQDLESEDTHGHQQNHRSEKSGVTEGGSHWAPGRVKSYWKRKDE